MRINQNIAAFNAYRNLNQTQNQLSSSLEKLSSGFRINRAADDASGLVNSENLRSQIGGLKVATRNAQDAISMVQTAEGAQTEVHSILQRMRDLVTQSGNIGTNDDAALQANQDEVNELVAELNRISDQTQFGTKKILNGDFAITPGDAAIDDGGTAAGANVAVGVGGATGGTYTLTIGGDGFGDPVTTAALAHDASDGDIEAAVAAAVGTRGTVGTNAGGFSITATEAQTGEIEVTLNDVDLVGATAPAATATSSATGADPVVTTPATPDTGGATFQVGANSGQTVTVGINSVRADAMGAGASGRFEADGTTAIASQFGSVAEINLTALAAGDLADGVADALATIDEAISSVSTNRATLGAFQNRMESTIRNVSVAVENLSAAESRIRDTDMAEEMVTFTRNQILQQAGTAMLAQANQVPQSVLGLLR